MTVEECANKVIDACLPSDVHGKSPEEQGADAARIVLDALQTLIRTEAERAADVCTELGDKLAADRWASLAAGCYRCHDEILRTSPGKAGG